MTTARPLLPDKIDDMVEGTLAYIMKNKWVDLTQTLQDYVAQSPIFARQKIRLGGGYTIQWKVQIDGATTARNTEMWDVDEYEAKDLLKTATADWTMQTASYTYELSEDIFQQGEQVLVQDTKVRLHAVMVNIADLMESNLWTAPTSTTQVPRQPYGLPFWLQRSATEGFNGGDPTGFSSGAGGLATGTYKGWQNYTFAYTAYTEDDLVDKLLRAMYKTKFKSPDPYPRPDGNPTTNRRGLFTTYAVINNLRKILNARNDNLGPELAVNMDSVTLRGNKFNAVPYLDANDSTNPIYGVDWETFAYYVKSGLDMVRSKPMPLPNQHRGRAIHFDHSCQYVCTNRCRNFVAYAA